MLNVARQQLSSITPGGESDDSTSTIRPPRGDKGKEREVAHSGGPPTPREPQKVRIVAML